MANPIVIPEGSVSTVNQDNCKLAWESVLPDATTAPASSDMLIDNMTTLKYTVGNATGNLDFEFDTAQSISYMAVAGANFQTYATTVEVYTWDGVSAYVKQSDISGLRNNQPVMLTFNQVETTRVRFKFISNAAGLEIGELAAGLTLDFPVPASVGFVPGHWSRRDEVTTGDTQSNAIARSTVNRRGTEENVTLKLIPYEWMDANWTDFTYRAQGYPVWFSWSPTKQRGQVSYGRWESPAPSYRTSLYADINLTIRGEA